MSKLKIVFMGTPDFAVAILEHLLEANYNIVGVVTAADKPAGRGRKIRESAVKKFATEKGLFVLQPTNLKDANFIEQLKQLNADLQIVVAFRMLPQVVWQLPKKGTFNLHASLLPHYRGAAPIHWAIINGEKKTGVTTFFIDDKIDTGAIILQQETRISEHETVGELHDKLMIIGAKLVAKTIDEIELQTYTTKKQPIMEEKQAPKLFAENCSIDWTDSLDAIYNKIRGLNPFPAAWTNIRNNGVETTAKLYGVKKETKEHSHRNGTILTTNKELKVAVTGGYIYIEEIKIAGKKELTTINLLNGYEFSSDAYMF